MKKLLSNLRSKKTIAAIVAAVVLVVGVPELSPLAPAITGMVCAAVECVE